MSRHQVTESAFEDSPSRFIVGIDLGTTNSAMSFVDTHDKRNIVRDFAIEQWVDFGVRTTLDVLPSFHYEATPAETKELQNYPQHARTVPEVSSVIGALARDRGMQMPGRQIASAKSWLCHAGIDRQAALLPWQNDPDVPKLSPVDASTRFLAYLRAVWDQAHGSEPLSGQDVVLTLPASFDEVARRLTVQAARDAGLPRIILIEEPQAAFYAWLLRHQSTWEKSIPVGSTILICDIGGGTTDFTLIRVRARDESTTSGETLDDDQRQVLSLHRVAVGKHLILGGDNLDLALAKLVESKIPGGAPLPPRSWDALRQLCRSAKEQLLGDNPPAEVSLNLLGSGSRLIGGSTRVLLDTREVQQVLLDGFFPKVEIHSQPASEVTGFQEFGLPYAQDPAITKHLASFLWQHRWDGRSEDASNSLDDLLAARPDFVLFNGGVLASKQIRERLVQQISGWFDRATPSKATEWQPKVLENDRLDLAVARGAAYFGLVRRGVGVRIEAKLARSYYLIVSQEPLRGLCIMPGSASPGDRARLTQVPLELTIGEPVQFSIAYSSTRLSDRVGEVVDIDTEGFSSLPPVRTVLQLAGRRRTDRLPVILETELSEIGTLQIWCATLDESSRWQLDFDVRAAQETDRPFAVANSCEAVVDQSVKDKARDVLLRAFGTDGELPPDQILSQLVQNVGMDRQQWPPSLLRGIWQDLLDLAIGSRRSPQHEARWLNLLGYCLRPGYGVAADDWRVGQTWRSVYGKLNFSAASSRNEALILWRRIAGGFTAGQQLAVYQQVAGLLRAVLDPGKRSKGSGHLSVGEFIESLRLVGSLELLPKQEKSQLLVWLLDLYNVKKWNSARGAMLWAIGRLGSRVPVYGPLNTVVDLDTVTQCLDRLLLLDDNDPNWQLAVMQCARRTHDRYRDIDQRLRHAIEIRLQCAPDHYRALVSEGGTTITSEATQIIGELMPLGIRLR